MGPWGTAGAAAALACSIAAAAAIAQPIHPTLHTPMREGGGVRWSATPILPPAWATTLPLTPRDSIQAQTLWRAAAAQGQPLELALIARLKLGQIQLALGDTLKADSTLAGVSQRAGLWQWQALSLRAAWRRARGQHAAADSLLDSVTRDGWPDAERGAWLLERARAREAMGDTAQSEAFARQVVRAYPSLGVGAPALGLLEARLRARRDSLAFQDERAAAEVEAFAGRRSRAEQRLRRALLLADTAQASGVARRLAEVRRGLRRFPQAMDAASLAYARAASPGDRSAALLERARIHRDQGRLDSALVTYDRAAAADSQAHESIAWEAAREAEDAGRWGDARARFDRVASLRASRANDAAVRSGLMFLAAGAVDSALGRWRSASGEAAEFWRAGALRELARRLPPGGARDLLGREADSTLRGVAARPGYVFYRVAARDTLGLRGWVADSLTRAGDPDPPVSAARTLVAIGASQEAQVLLSRWNARDPRLVDATEPRAPELLLAGAEVAYAAGAPPQAIALSEQAARGLEASVAGSWAATPWGYPPAFDSLVSARPDSLEPELLWAVMRQESRFDARARSRSDALGLMQLKLETAADMARLLREPRPSEATLFEPRASVRYGARYLRRLLDRFGGVVSVALSAYNAGPSTIPPYWRELIDRGGEALFGEIASNADAQDYVRKIVANRAAYRELAPARR